MGFSFIMLYRIVIIYCANYIMRSEYIINTYIGHQSIISGICNSKYVFRQNSHHIINLSSVSFTKAKLFTVLSLLMIKLFEC